MSDSFDDDLLKDIKALSEHKFNRGNHGIHIKTPVSIKNYQATVKTLPKYNETLPENCTYIISGRGRGIKDRVVRPGDAVEYDPKDDILLKKEIRQVVGTSHLMNYGETSRSEQQSYKYDQIHKTDTGQSTPKQHITKDRGFQLNNTDFPPL